MEYRSLGHSGLKVSAVGLGCNNFGMTIDDKQTKAVVDAAIDHGITLFDTADIYGGKGTSETYLGKALGKKRSEILIASKFGNPMGDGPYGRGGSRHYVMRAVEDSLRRLKTDFIDLYQIHTPDPETPIEETLSALDDLVRSGKVRYVGCSNFSGWQLVEAQWTASTNGLAPFISAQNRYSVISREIELDLTEPAEQYGVGILPYFPLESGLLTGKYKKDKRPAKGTRWHAWQGRGAMEHTFWSDEKFAAAEQLQSICDRDGATLLDLAFGWLLSNPNVSSVIAGATKPSQIAGNVKAASYQPSGDILASVDELTKPYPTGGIPRR